MLFKKKPLLKPVSPRLSGQPDVHRLQLSGSVLLSHPGRTEVSARTEVGVAGAEPLLTMCVCSPEEFPNFKNKKPDPRKTWGPDTQAAGGQPSL